MAISMGDGGHSRRYWLAWLAPRPSALSAQRYADREIPLPFSNPTKPGLAVQTAHALCDSTKMKDRSESFRPRSERRSVCVAAGEQGITRTPFAG